MCPNGQFRSGELRITQKIFGKEQYKIFPVEKEQLRNYNKTLKH